MGLPPRASASPGPDPSPRHPDYRSLAGPPPDAEWAPGAFATPAPLIQHLFAKLKLEERRQQNKLRHAWPALVGDFNAQHSFPDSLKRGVLFVRVSSAALKHSMELMKRPWLTRLQEQFGATTVRDIRFTL